MRLAITFFSASWVLVPSRFIDFFRGVLMIGIPVHDRQIIIQMSSHMSAIHYLGEFDLASFLGFLDRSAEIQKPISPKKMFPNTPKISQKSHTIYMGCHLSISKFSSVVRLWFDWSEADMCDTPKDQQ